MRLYWRILARYYRARAGRALRKAAAFSSRSEKFFQLVKGMRP